MLGRQPGTETKAGDVCRSLPPPPGAQLRAEPGLGKLRNAEDKTEGTGGRHEAR